MIAKVPYHITVPKYLATAGEAATLAFPLLEKAPRVCLKTNWLDLTQRQIGKLAHGFVEMEVKLSEVPFSATGSLYFKKDIPSS